MKILYFHQHFSTPSGSTGTRSYEMARALVEAGHEVTMVCGSYQLADSGLSGPFVKGRREGWVDKIRVIELELPYSNYQGLWRRSGVFLTFAMHCIGIAIRESSELVFATSTPLTAGIPGIASRWLKKTVFIFEVRDLWPDLPRAMGVVTNPVILAMMSMLEWVSYRSAHGCIGLSPGIVAGIEQRTSQDKEVILIPNGCDLQLFGEDSIEGRRPEGVRDTDMMAVFTGAHGRANGLEAVLNAAEILLQRGRMDIKFVFIGDGKEKPDLCRRAEESGLTNCIFLDPVSKQVLKGYMAGADLGLMILANVEAFYHGTSPNKFFDYLSAGLPVLNNYPGWLAEMITEHDCGYTFAPDDANIFADVMEEAADNPEQLQRKGANGLKLGRECFDRKDLARKFVRYLEKYSQ